MTARGDSWLTNWLSGTLFTFVFNRMMQRRSREEILQEVQELANKNIDVLVAAEKAKRMAAGSEAFNKEHVKR